MTRFSCILIGNESLLIGCADLLLARDHDIRAVVSRDPGIQAWARARSLPLFDRPDALPQAPGLGAGAVDWLFSVANLAVLSPSVLALAARGAVNFHDGPLPRYAGLNAPAWAVMAGESRYGISWHMIEGDIDEGDLLEQRLFDLDGSETAFTLNSKCYGAALESFPALVEQLETGTPRRRPQDLSQRSYCARLDRPAAAGRLVFTRPAMALAAQVRGLDFGAYWNPLTLPKLDLGGRPVLVRRAAPLPGPASGALPGTVLEHGPSGVVVATGSGDLRLSGFAHPDGTPLDILDRVADGMRLASPAPDEAERLTATLAACLPAEPQWRRALQRLDPLPVPLAGPGGAAPDWHEIRIALPVALDDTTLKVAVATWALQGAGLASGDLALADGALQTAASAAPGYLTPWVPLTVTRDQDLPALAEQVAQGIGRLASGGFASDLMARDPQIGAVAPPAVGLALEGAGAIPGTAVTVALRAGRPVLIVDRARLDDTASELLAQRLESILGALRGGLSGPVTATLALPPAERNLTLTAWNATAAPVPGPRTLHQAFADQAARSPDAVALIFEDQRLTYAQLAARARGQAARLVAAGVQPGQTVGLFLRRGPDLVVGALAILMAGAAYVPMDPAYPADRLAHYLADSAAAAVLTEAALRDNLPDSAASPVLIDTSTAPDAPSVTVAGTDLAYVIYTSGSTGTPKGVMVEHRNVANFMAGMDAVICPDRDRDDQSGPDRPGVWLAVTSLNFDISVLELFWTLSRGFTVVLAGDDNRAAVSNGPLPVSGRRMDFNLMYWGNDDGPGPRKYELLLEGAKFADAHGFNAVWTPERHFHAFGGPYPNPAVTGAAVAAVTRNLGVRAGSCVAPLHHPARIAEEWAVIDNLTGGRAGIGFASGWQPDDFILRPENTPPANKPAMFAAIDTVRRLWRGETVSFPRQDGSPHAVVTQPRPVSAELPVWVTTAGNPDTWREAGQHGAHVLTHLLGQSIDEVAGKIRIYHDALRAAGHDPAQFKVTLMLHTYLAQTRDQARDTARGPMKDYLRAAAGLIKQYAWAFPAFKRPKGVSNAFEMDLGVLTPEELDAILDFAFERYFEDSGLFGTIEDAALRVEELKRIGVNEIACLIDYGIAPEQVLEGLKPLAQVLARANAPSAPAADDHSLAALILRHGVTHLQCTPSMARLIAMNDEARQALGQVRHLLLGGEALPGDLLADLRDATGARVLNMYGPTETTIWSTTAELAPRTGSGAGAVPIGRPIANTTVYVLDENGQPAPIGVPGELAIGGAGVARGYWQRPDLTADRFRPDPLAAEAGLPPQDARIYMTGDLVRWRADGQLVYLGRSDHQVKIRGQRIELGEIEARLTAQPGVTGAVVVARAFGPGDLRLVAYVTAPDPIDPAALTAVLARDLPQAMVPAHFERLAEFPLTPNKKIDRKALPAPRARQRPVPPEPAAVLASAPVPAPAPAAAPARAPGTDAAAPADAQARIAAIWSRLLGVGDIGPEDNFFALGGHSLLAVQAHREIRTALDLPRLSITDIFRFPTLRGLSGHIGVAPGPAQQQGQAPAKDPAQPIPRASPQEATPPHPAAPDTAPTAPADNTMSRRRAMRALRENRG